MHMYVWRYAEHRNAPVKSINEAFYNIACPFFSHTGVCGEHLYRLEYCDTLVDLGFVVCKIQRITHTLFVSIKKDLSFLLEVGNELIQQSL